MSERIEAVTYCIELPLTINAQNFSIASKKTYSIYEVAKLFKTKIKLLPKRPGERYNSSLVNKNLSNKIFKYYGKKNLKEYIEKIINNHY